MYVSAGEPDKALSAFQQGLALVSHSQREALLRQVPAAYRAKLAQPAIPQTSASKG
jgi:hypothetical protein